MRSQGSRYQVLDLLEAPARLSDAFLQGGQCGRSANGLLKAEHGVGTVASRHALRAPQQWIPKRTGKVEKVHIIITDAWLAKSRALHLNGLKLVAAGALASVLLMLGAITTYHWVFLEGVRQSWPGFAPVARLVHQDEANSQNAYMRANLDAMARM